MNPAPLYQAALDGLRKSFEGNRLAHAYLIAGSPRGNALRLAEELLTVLFGIGRDVHQLADVQWVEPEGKARVIKADAVRGLIKRINETSYEGGWKAGVLIAADRMNTSSQNALLKTLEEPPPRSLLLLLSAAPQEILPTLVSRCQQIRLEQIGSGLLEELWREPLLEMLAGLPPRTGFGATVAASQLLAILDTLETHLRAEELPLIPESLSAKERDDLLDGRVRSRLLEVRSEILGELLHWMRDLLVLSSGADAKALYHRNSETVLREQAAWLDPLQALKNVQAVEVLIDEQQRLARRDALLIESAFRRLIIRG